MALLYKMNRIKAYVNEVLYTPTTIALSKYVDPSGHMHCTIFTQHPHWVMEKRRMQRWQPLHALNAIDVGKALLQSVCLHQTWLHCVQCSR